MTGHGKELREVEARVAKRRRELRQAARAWTTTQRDTLVSARGLAGVVGAAFAIGTMLGGRRSPAPLRRGLLPGLLALLVAGLRLRPVLAGPAAALAASYRRSAARHRMVSSAAVMRRPQ